MLYRIQSWQHSAITPAFMVCLLAFYIRLRFNCSLFTLTCSLERIVGYFESFGDVHSSADFIIILFSGRKVPLTMEHAIHEIIIPVVD
jgi:hypothetical protein